MSSTPRRVLALLVLKKGQNLHGQQQLRMSTRVGRRVQLTRAARPLEGERCDFKALLSRFLPWSQIHTESRERWHVRSPPLSHSISQLCPTCRYRDWGPMPL